MSLAALLAAVAVGVSPQIPHRDGLVHVRVAGLAGKPAQVQLAGGLASGGRWFDWVPLHGDRALLRAPGFLGVYPVQVRLGGKVNETNTFVKILPRGFERQPAFFTPREVVDWWASRLPQGSSVRSAETWHSGFFTHRDPRFNLLVRARVQLAGYGLRAFFVSMARLRPNGPWRFLETTTAP